MWELNAGQVAQTLHAHEEAITHMLVWENFLLTCSLDAHIKIWEISENPVPDLVVKTEPTFDFTKDAEETGQQSFRRQRVRDGAREKLHCNPV